jgi:flagellar basal-body rod protein FlgG
MTARLVFSPAEILTQANRLLAEDLGGDNYVTASLAAIHPETRTLRHASAGHPATWVLDATGQIVTNNGETLLPGITVPPNAKQISVGSDGTVSVLAAGATAPTQVGQIQLANFINPAGLQARGENLFLETAASGTAQTNVPGTNGLGALNQGFVETSNVNVTEELVNLITAQRAFEINSRSIQSSDQMLQKLTQL